MSRIAVLLLCLAPLVSAAPPYYRKADTWHETLRLSREARTKEEAAAAAAVPPKGFKPGLVTLRYESDPVRISVDVTGLERLCIRVTCPKAKRQGTICFGSPSVIAKGKTTPLTRHRPLFMDIQGDRHLRDEKDKLWKEAKLDAGRAKPQPTGIGGGNDDLDITLDDDEDDKAVPRFARGFMIKNNTEVVYHLGGKYDRFEAWVCMLPSENAPEDVAQVAVDFKSTLGAKAKNAEARELLWKELPYTFADAASAREQQIEQRSGVWNEDWTPGDVSHLALKYAQRSPRDVRKLAETLARAAKTPADLAAVRGAFYLKEARDRLAFARKTLDFVERDGPQPALAAELAAIEKAVQGPLAALPPNMQEITTRAMSIRRRIILAHPALAFERLLINKRPLSRYNHMCDQYLGRHSGVGDGLIILDDWKDNPKETVLLKGKLPPGSYMHPDLSYDGTRILFSYCDHNEKRNDYRRFWIYEVNVDGTGLRQLTGTGKDPREGWEGRETVLIEDWDPVYLPDGGFAFVTTRSQSFGRCHGSRYVPTYMVFRANGDGSGIRQLSFGEANEWDPAVMADGRLIYCRWDYINRHDTIYQSLWTMRPDGTATAHYYGNYSRSPCMITEAQSIPGSHKVVATATDHHGHTGGNIIVIDPRLGQEEGTPLKTMTPELGYPESGQPNGITLTERPHHTRGQRAATPWPLTEDLFLVAYQQDNRYAIYLIDSLGGRELIYRDAGVSCFAPIPLRARTRPPIIETPLPDRAEMMGTFTVQDVHKSTEDIPQGAIKRLRINRIYGQPVRSKPGLSLANNEIIKGILGTVPVNEDGSVSFRAPAGIPLQIQALDKDGMAIMTMRSLVYLQPGEKVTCVGCHEPRLSTPQNAAVPPVLHVRDIEPPAGPQYEGGFSFIRTVQPVLDRHCIGCHGLDKTEKGVNLIATRNGKYNGAHDSLAGKGMLTIAYRNRETGSSKPKDYFAHAGKLVKVIREKHKDRVKLPREDFQRIVDWLDLNAQYYGDYSHNRIEKQRPKGDGEKALRAHIAATFGEKLAKQPFEALVNLAAPGESRILNAPLAAKAGGWGQIAKGGWTAKTDPGYARMIELIGACIPTLGREDINGTCGGGKRCSCGCCWVRLMRADVKKAGGYKKTAMLK